MTLITRATDASLDVNSAENQLTGLYAGEDLDVAAPCYIKTSDGKVYMSNATSANEAAEVAGFAPRAVKSGQPVTLFGTGTIFRYGSGLTAGNRLYIGATKGRLDDAVTPGDLVGVAVVLNTTDIRVEWENGQTALAANVVTTAAIAANAVTEAKIEAGAAGAGLTGLVTKFAAEANVIGAIPVVHSIAITAGANADTDVTLTHKTRIIDAWLILRGAGVASAVLTVKNAATAITDGMAASGSDKAVVRCASIDDAQYEIAAGGTLRVTGSGGASQPAAIVYVLGLRVA